MNSAADATIATDGVVIHLRHCDAMDALFLDGGGVRIELDSQVFLEFDDVEVLAEFAGKVVDVATATEHRGGTLA